jgi:PleD family two-component response regulator
MNLTENNLSLLLASRNGSDSLVFREALDELNMAVEFAFVENSRQLMDHFLKRPVNIPHILFMENGLPFCGGLNCLKEIRNDNSLVNVAIALYSSCVYDKHVEEAMTNGANIFIIRPNDLLVMKHYLKQVITVFWQYHVLGLRKDYLLINVRA